MVSDLSYHRRNSADSSSEDGSGDDGGGGNGGGGNGVGGGEHPHSPSARNYFVASTRMTLSSRRGFISFEDSG
jgi:hypothetical protein